MKPTLSNQVVIFLNCCNDEMVAKYKFNEWKHPHSINLDGHISSSGGTINWAEFFAIHADSMDAVINFGIYLKSDPEYISFLQKAEAFKNRDIDFNEKSLALDLFRDYILSVENSTFSDIIATVIAKTFSEAIRDGVTGFRKISILDGFSSDLDRIDCGDGYVIRRFQKGESERLHFKWYKDREKLGIAEFCIEKIEESRFEDHIVEGHNYDTKFQAILTCLRLLAPGKVFAAVMHWERIRPGSIARDKGMIGDGVFYPQYAFKGSYPFDSANAEIIADLVDVLEPSAECKIRRKYKKLQIPAVIPRELKLAINRIVSSTQRPNAEDSFIDHIVALDAVFGSDLGGFPGGLSYTLAMRASKYLFDDFEDRKKCFRTLKSALGVRGRIVHGKGGMNELKEKEKSIINEIELLSRKAVVKVCLNQLNNGLPFMSEIFDDELLR